MKNYIIKLLMLCIVTISFVACTKDEIDVYSGEEQIYFKWAMDGTDPFGRVLVDSLSYSFAFENQTVTETVYNVPVKIQGFVSDQDRVFDLKVSEESDAQEGVHFTIPDNLVIPANNNSVDVPITLKRAEDLKQKEVSLKLELVSNENFEANIYGTTNSTNANELLSYNTFELTLSDILVEPAVWSSFMHYYLGTYSVKKLYLFAEVNNMSVPDWDKNGYALSEFFAQKDVLKAYLAAQKQAGTPVLEEDGTEMTLGRYA